jgi:hypothetical protein
MNDPFEELEDRLAGLAEHAPQRVASGGRASRRRASPSPTR